MYIYDILCYQRNMEHSSYFDMLNKLRDSQVINIDGKSIRNKLFEWIDFLMKLAAIFVSIVSPS